MDVFTIVKIGWEYNDEYYYTHENDEGNPVVVYRNREGAEAECLAKNIEYYKEISESQWSTIGAYFQEYDFSELEDYKSELKNLGVTVTADEIDLPKAGSGASDDDWVKIIRLLGVVFYKIEVLEYVE